MTQQDHINQLNAKLNAWDRAKEDGNAVLMDSAKKAANYHLNYLMSKGYSEEECFAACGR